MKKLFTFAIMCGIVALVIAVRSTPNAQALANPASVYCTQLGGTETIDTAPDGSQDSYCHLPNNISCNSWDLYRGGCPGFPPASSGVLYDTNGRLLKEGDLISAVAYGDPDIYIILYKPHGDLAGYKRLFLNPAIFSFYGHLGGFANVHPVTPTTRDLFETSGIFRNCETNNQKIWATEITGEDSGVLHHVQMTGAQAVAEDANFFSRVFCINTHEENFYPKSVTPYTSLSQIPVYIRPSCIPRPACLDTVPQCYPPEPAEGWCPVSALPPGCYIQHIECVTVPCDQPLVCPAGTYDHVFITGVALQPITVTSPISFQATITGNLASPCYSLLPLSVVQSGDAFYIVVRVAASISGQPCAMVLAPFERKVILTPTGQTSGQYRVYVNGDFGATYDVPR